MFKYNSLDKLKYNDLGKSKYNGTPIERLGHPSTRIGPRPIILNQDRQQEAILENSFDVTLSQEVGGKDEIAFSIPMGDPKRDFIKNENLVQMFDTFYVIREVVDRKKDRITEVYAEATWYDLQYADILTETEWEDELATNIMSSALEGTEWAVGTVEFVNRRTLNVTIDYNRLEVLSDVESLFGGELEFDTQLQLVHLRRAVGKHSGASISFDKNAEDIEARYDTRDLITRLYIYGKSDLTIEDANDGVVYVENHGYTDLVRTRSVKDERFTNPYHMKEIAENALETMAKPRASYFISMAELSNRAGLEHEEFTMGSKVRVYDKELGINLEVRIMSWEYNVIEPYRTKLTLESKAKTLSDLLAEADDFGSRFESGDSVDRAEMLDLSVFNLLLNARGDDGFSYWENNGWEIDPTSGASGNASFKASGDTARARELYQTVYPSNHDSYAISFKSQTKSLDVLDGGRVGVEVTVKYEDGTEDKQFVSLVD